MPTLANDALKKPWFSVRGSMTTSLTRAAVL